MADKLITRRNFLRSSGSIVAASSLAGCSQFDFLGNRDNDVRNVLETANLLTYRVQRMLLGPNALAPEYPESEIRQPQRPNGSTNPNTAEYVALKQNAFRDYRLRVTGLVDKEIAVSLAELHNMPVKSQVTRHDCVEGWSCIAKWTGVQVSYLLDMAGVKAGAKYLVFHCYDTLGGGLSGGEPYYESCDMIDAYHPQTIAAFGLNNETLPISNGAPIRVRIERALGYKQPKYVSRIEVTNDNTKLGRGKGSYWADHGYDWYAGI